MYASDAEHTFLFADLAGYTALTEAMGDQDAADLAGEFCDAVLTDTTRDAAGELDDIQLDERGRHSLKNVAEAVLLFAARPAGEHSASGLPLDPVCHMAVDPAHAAGLLNHDGVAYHFCSLA